MQLSKRRQELETFLGERHPLYRKLLEDFFSGSINKQILSAGVLSLFGPEQLFLHNLFISELHLEFQELIKAQTTTAVPTHLSSEILLSENERSRLCSYLVKTQNPEKHHTKAFLDHSTVPLNLSESNGQVPLSITQTVLQRKPKMKNLISGFQVGCLARGKVISFCELSKIISTIQEEFGVSDADVDFVFVLHAGLLVYLKRRFWESRRLQL